jgi:predicted transcriptional regulator
MTCGGEARDTLTARLPTSTTWELDRLAAAWNVTRSEIVRRALVAYLRRHAERVDDARASR